MARVYATIGGLLGITGLRHKYDEEYARQWIKTCLAQGGTPIVRTRYGRVPLTNNSAIVVCYGGIGPEMTETWEELPDDLWEALDKSKDDLKVLLEYVAPDIYTELRMKFEEEQKKLMELQFKKGYIRV